MLGEIPLRHERARAVSLAARNEDEIQMYFFPLFSIFMFLKYQKKVHAKKDFIISQSD